MIDQILGSLPETLGLIVAWVLFLAIVALGLVLTLALVGVLCG